THDRYLLDRVVTRTLELHQGKLYSYDGAYEAFLAAKAERVALEERTEKNRQNFLRRELEWLRRQPKARTGKQKARIDRARATRAAPSPKAERIARIGVGASASAQTVLELRDVSLSIDDRALVRSLSLLVGRGQRIGVVGPNGVGKTTLLRTIV